jgi:hypothetical protein
LAPTILVAIIAVAALATADAPSSSASPGRSATESSPAAFANAVARSAVEQFLAARPRRETRGRQALYLTILQERSRGLKRYEDTVRVLYLHDLYSKPGNRNLSAREAVRRANAYVNKIKYDHGIEIDPKKIGDINDTLNFWIATLNVSREAPVIGELGLGLLSQLGIEILSHYKGKTLEELAATGPDGLDVVDRMRELRAVEDATWTATFDRVDASPGSPFEAAVDALLAEKLDAFMGDDAKTLLKKHPALRSADAMARIFNQQGELRVSQEQLKKLLQEGLLDLSKITREELAYLISLDARMGTIEEWIRNSEAREAEAAAREKAARDNELRIAGVRSSVYILSTLLDYVDPQAGEAFRVVGNGFAQVLQSLTQFTDNWVASPDLRGFTTAILAGDLLAVGMSFIPLFTRETADPVLAQIERIGELVEDLSTEMHDRFDRVDAALNQVFAAMAAGFDQLDRRLVGATQKVVTLQAQLVDLERDLHALETNLVELLTAGFRRSFWEAVNGGLGYQRRTGRAMTYDTYLFYENIFYTWAVSNSRDPLATGGTEGRRYGTADLWFELSKPLDRNLNYLSNLTVTWGLDPFAKTVAPLPNPQDWALAARAYAELAAEWPAHAIKVSPQRMANVIGTGAEVEEVVSELAAARPAARRDYLRTALARYRTLTGDVETAFAAAEQQYMVANQINNLWSKEDFLPSSDYLGLPRSSIAARPASRWRLPATLPGSSPSRCGWRRVFAQVPGSDCASRRNGRTPRAETGLAARAARMKRASRRSWSRCLASTSTLSRSSSMFGSGRPVSVLRPGASFRVESSSRAGRQK